MNIAEAKAIYLPLDPGAARDALGLDEWLDIADTIEKCRQAVSLDDAVKVLAKFNLYEPVRFAQAFRGETGEVKYCPHCGGVLS